jgi:hypothetical protein
MVQYGRTRQTWNEEECTSSPGTGEEARNAADQETAPRETGEEESPFITLKRRTKQVPRNYLVRGSLQTSVPIEGRVGDKAPDEEDRNRGTPTMGLASEGTSGGPLKGDDDMERSGTSSGARVESSGRTDLRGVEDMVSGDEAGWRRNEGNQGSEG